MTKAKKIAIGIDIGGSGIKGAPVSMKSGKFKAERLRIPTPENASPEEIAQIVKTIVESFDLPDAPVGVTFPAPIVNGIVPVIANPFPRLGWRSYRRTLHPNSWTPCIGLE